MPSSSGASNENGFSGLAQTSGFTFNQQPNGSTQSFNNLQQPNPFSFSPNASFPPFTGGSNSSLFGQSKLETSSFSFTPSSNQPPNNPFASQNISSTGLSSNAFGGSAGFQGKIFNIAPLSSETIPSSQNLFTTKPLSAKEPASSFFGQSESSIAASEPKNIFGQKSGTSELFQSQPTASATFDQSDISLPRTSTNAFGVAPPGQLSQPASHTLQDEDVMSISPDASPQAKDPANMRPFGFLNASLTPKVNGTDAKQSKSDNLFGDISRLSKVNSTDSDTNEPVKPQTGGLFDNISQPSFDNMKQSGSNLNRTFFGSHSEPGGNRLAFPISPQAVVPESLQSPGINTENMNKATFSKKLQPDTEISPSASQPEDIQPTTSSSIFGSLKIPSAMASPHPSALPAPFVPPFLTSVQSPSEKLSQTEVAVQPSSTATNSVLEPAVLDLTSTNQLWTVQSEFPANFTKEERQQVHIAYQLRCLDAGLQEYLMKPESTQFEPDDITGFYLEVKDIILSGKGYILDQLDSTKRKYVGLEAENSTRSKRVRFGVSPLASPKGQAAHEERLGKPESQPLLTQPASLPQATITKRKAHEDLTIDDTQKSNDNGKRARLEVPAVHTSPAPHAKSQTSNFFKNILDQKDSLSQSPKFEKSQPSQRSNIQLSSDGFANSDLTNNLSAGESNHIVPTSTMPTILQQQKPGESPQSSAGISTNLNSAAGMDVPLKRPPAASKSSNLFLNEPVMSNDLIFKTSQAEKPLLFAPPKFDTPKFDIPKFATPTFENASSANFLSQFAKAADENNKKEKARRKAEDFDSDEDNETAWEQRDAEEQRAKKQILEEGQKGKIAKFVPGKGFSLTNVDTEKDDTNVVPRREAAPVTPFAFGTSSPNQIIPKSSEHPMNENIFGKIQGPKLGVKDKNFEYTLNSHVSVLSKSSHALPNGHNIFGHLSDAESGAEGSKTGDADDEETASEEEDNGLDGGAGSVNKYTPDVPPTEIVEAAKPSLFTTTSSVDLCAASDADRFEHNSSLSTGRSLFDRISKDENGNAIREIPPPADSKAGSLTNSDPSAATQSTIGITSETSDNPLPVSSPPTVTSNIPRQSSPALNETGKNQTPLVSKPNIFGHLSSTGSTPPKSGPAIGPTGDHTWKVGSPIAFGVSSTGPPELTFTSPSPSKPTLGGLFGSPPADQNADHSAKPTASLFSITPSKAAGTSDFGFNFGGPPKPPTASLIPPVTATSNTTSRATSPGVTTGGESANESLADGVNDDDVEKHEQLDLASGGPGEEDEDVLFLVKAKALLYDPSSKSWPGQGVGILRILKHRETSKARVLMRQDPSGKIVLNAALLGGIKYENTQPKTVKMAAATDAGKLATWMIRTGKDEDATELAQILEANKSN